MGVFRVFFVGFCFYLGLCLGFPGFAGDFFLNIFLVGFCLCLGLRGASRGCLCF